MAAGTARATTKTGEQRTSSVQSIYRECKRVTGLLEICGQNRSDRQNETNRENTNMKIKCECSKEITAQPEVDPYTPNYEVITWYCSYCNRTGTKLIKHDRHGPVVVFDQRERVAVVANEPHHRRIAIESVH